MKRTPKTIASELLVLQVQSGDRAAFDELFRLWMPVIYGRCLRQLREPEDARDASQKVWLKIFQGIHRLKDPACFLAWSLRIAHLTCTDTIRKQIRRGAVRQEMSGQDADDCELSSRSYEEEAIDLKVSIMNLPTSQQQILDLYYVVGFSVAEIAQILGLATGTVKSRLHTARQALKLKLKTGENHE